MNDWTVRRRKMLGAAFVAGLALRFIVAAYSGPISNDAASFYLPNAEALVVGGLGNWQAMTIAVPPLFPTLVALLYPVFGDLEYAALAISMVAAAAMVFPTLSLAEQLYPGRRDVHTWTIVLATVHPFSVRFGGDAKADAFYALLFATTLAIGLRLWRSPTLRRGAAFGALLGLAYLVRPEALGLAILMAIAVLLETELRRRRGGSAGAYLRRAVVAGVVSVLLLAPSVAWNVAFVYQKIGVLTLSPKAGVIQEYDNEAFADMDSLNADRTMTLYEEKMTSADSYRSFSAFGPFIDHPRETLSSCAFNIYEFIRLFPPALGVTTSVLFLIGIVFYRRRIDRRMIRAVWVLYAFYGLALSLFYVSRRFWLPLIPALVPVCAAGLHVVTLWLRRRIGSRQSPAFITRRWQLRRVWPGIVIVALMLPEGTYRGLTGGVGWFDSPEKQLAHVLRERFGEDLRIVSRKGRVTFYAGGDNLPLPANELDDIVRYMKHRDSQIIVVNDRRRRGKHVRHSELYDQLERRDDFRRIDWQDDESGLSAYHYVGR